MLLYNKTIYRLLFIFAAVFLLGVTFNIAFIFADDKSVNANGDVKDKMISISSDKLLSNSEENYAEFIGNVKAIQGTSVITATRLKIYYNKGLSDNKDITASEESINKIVANGNVKIEFDNKTIETENAVYKTAKRVLVLSGANSKIISGNNSIAGSKITLYRDSGLIQVDSNSEKRVEALIYPGEKGIK